MHKIRLVCLFVTLSLIFHTAECQDATLYEHHNYEGQSIQVSVPTGECKNILEFNDRATSLKTNKCIRLWEDYGCTGRKVDIQPPGIANLVSVAFNDLTTSVSDCQLGTELKEDVQITMHLNGASDLADHAEKIRKMMLEWFPFIQNNLWSPAYKTVREIKVYFDIKDNGIYASGNEIHIPAQYVRNNKGDTGVFIHEMTHVIHQARNCPGWVVEGMAEYMRRWFYEPEVTRKPVHQTRVTDNPYTGDWLLAYLSMTTRRPLIYTINKACQEGTWRDNFMRELTGRDEQEWWTIMINDENFPKKRT